MNDWNIQSRSHWCQACEAHFVDKQPYHTILLDEKNQYQRKDICQTCWESQQKEGEDRHFLSYWQGIYQKPPAAPPEAIQKDTAESLLRKLIELNESQYAAASYILAVMLERKRILKVKEQFVREGTRVFLYEQPKTGDFFTIPDPNLQLDQLEEIQKQVAGLLEHGIPQQAPADQPPAPEQAPSGENALP